MIDGPCGWNDMDKAAEISAKEYAEGLRRKSELDRMIEFADRNHHEARAQTAKVDVERPAYYAHGIEPIGYMRSRFTPAEFRGYLRGNCLKYLSRYTDKNGVEDLRKAEVYLKWLIELEVNNVHSA